MLGMAVVRVKLTNSTDLLWVSIRSVMKNFIVWVVGCLVAALVNAQPVRVDAVEVELVADRTAAVAGQPLSVGLLIRHDPHWHTYWRNPGDSGLPTRLDLTLPEGWTAAGIAWPMPQRIFIGPLANYGYEGDLLLPVALNVPASLAAGRVTLSGKASWLMCKDVCIPGEATVRLELPVQAQAAASPHAGRFDRNAAATPRSVMPVRAFVAPGAVSLLFDRPALARAEFFPYQEGLVSAPAPQALHRLGPQGASSWRMELRTADGVDAAAFDKAGFFGAVSGLLVLDGQPVEVKISRADAAPESGTKVSVASGAQDTAAQGGAAGLLGALGGATTPGAQATEGDVLSLVLAVLFGVLGGLILNLMPCVFPVIGLKVLAFARDAGGHPREMRLSALAFAAGVLVSFWGLAALLLALRAAGQSVGWGFQLQSAPFVASMALLFMLIGLNLVGVFEVGVGLTRLGNFDPAARGGTGAAGSFGSGALAVLVATPCTAPFMGSALGFTLGRPAVELFLVFGAIAVGMALPYLALGWFPRALAWLPRPGRWMESFRQLLAFPMFATVAWLAWVLGQQAGVDAVLGLTLGAVLLSMACWLYGRFVQSPSAVHRGLAAVLAALALLAALFVAWPQDVVMPTGGTGATADGAGSGDGSVPGSGGARAAGWQAWSDATVERELAAGHAVFVDFTAAWCVSCQVNKKLVLERDPVAAEMQGRGVVRLRADWTHRDTTITAALARHQRNGVPLYLLYTPGQVLPRVLPELLTPGIVMQALAEVH